MFSDVPVTAAVDSVTVGRFHSGLVMRPFARFVAGSHRNPVSPVALLLAALSVLVGSSLGYVALVDVRTVSLALITAESDYAQSKNGLREIEAIETDLQTLDRSSRSSSVNHKVSFPEARRSEAAALVTRLDAYPDYADRDGQSDRLVTSLRKAVRDASTGVEITAPTVAEGGQADVSVRSRATHEEGRFDAALALARELRARERQRTDRNAAAVAEAGRVAVRQNKLLATYGGLLALLLLGASVQVSRQVRRRRDEAAERRFQATFERAPVGIAHVAPDGRLLRVNDRFCEIVGLAPAELTAFSFQDITHPDDLEGDMQNVSALLDGRLDRYSMEKRYVGKNGSTTWVNLTVSLVQDAAGRPDYFVSVIEDISGRKLMEKRLVEERDRNQRYLQVAATMFVVLDASGHVETINPAGARILGYDTTAELIGRDWFETALPAEERAGVRAVFTALMNGSVSELSAFENGVLRADGTMRWVSWRNSILRDADGRIVGTVSSGEDVTDRRTTEALLRGISEAVPGLVYAKDANGRTLYANPFTAKVIGRSLDEVIGATDADWASDPLEAEAIMANDRRIMTEEVSETIEEPFTSPDGSTRVWLSTKAPLRDAADRAIGIVGVSMDITPLKLAERELREINDRFSMAQANAGFGIWERDLKTGTAKWDATTRALYELGPDDPAGDPAWRARVHPEDGSMLEAAVSAMLDRGELLDLEHRIVRPDGSHRWLSVLGRRTEEGDRALGVIFDTTRRHEAEAALKEALKGQEVLLYEVNHRVKNSLQLVTALMLIEASKITDQRARDAVLDARAKITTISKLHQRLYADGGHDAVDYPAFLRDLVEGLPLAQEREGVRTIVSATGQPMLGIRFGAPLAMAVTELVTNALKYAFPGQSGQVDVLYRATDASIELSVVDNGIGLPANINPERATSTGMKIVRGLVRQIGAQLRVESTAGRTAFHISLQKDQK